MPFACDLRISFATAGNSLAYLGGGWARSEAQFTWAVGAESHLVLPGLAPEDEYVLTLDATPFIHAPELPSQRLIVSVNDVVLGSSDLCRPTLLGYRIPAGLTQGFERTVVTLQHPDATRPKDFAGSPDDRTLAFALSEATLCKATGSRQGRLPAGLMLGSPDEPRSAARPPGPSVGPSVGPSLGDLTGWATSRTGLSLSEIAMRFESLGENCEFGLFQRRCDAEPLGLLRFSSTFMRNLIRGIDSRFEGLGAIEDIDPRLEGGPPKEYMIHEKRFGLVYHTFVYEGQRSAWLMREQEAARLKFLRRKFLEELASTDKIFVYKFGAGVALEEILPLHLALNRHGEATLLWVVPTERDRPPGTVEVVMPGLLKGYIDRFAPEDNAHDFSFDGWLRLCANACVLARLRPGADRPDADRPDADRPGADISGADTPDAGSEHPGAAAPAPA